MCTRYISPEDREIEDFWAIKLERDRVAKQLIFDKRSLVLLEEHDFDRWLTCTVEKAREMLLLTAMSAIDAGLAADGGAREEEEEAAEA
jgi:putative SOS response-associated peptidase YedK